MSHILYNAVNKSSTFNNDKEIIKIINQHPRLVKIKKKAKLLKKSISHKDTPLSSLLDIVSQELGFKHWHEAYTNIKNLYYPKSYKLDDLYSFGLSKPNNMDDDIHLGHNSTINMNLWIKHKNLLQHTTIFGENNERKKLHSYLFKQIIANNYSLTLIDNTSLINELENYMTEEKIERYIYKLKVINQEEYINSPYKDKIDKTTASLLNGYIEHIFNDIFREQKFENYSIKENEQIKALAHIVFYSFNAIHDKSHNNPSSYSRYNYYQAIKNTGNFEHLLTEYKNETFSKGYINKNGHKGTYTQMHTHIKDYLYSLESFDVNNINKTTLENHNKLKRPLIEFLDYLANNLYFYFESTLEKKLDNTESRLEPCPYIYSIAISESLLQYNKPIISQLMTHILYKNADMVSMFRNADAFVLKKELKPLTDKKLIFINDCPLLSIFDRLSNIATSNNTSLIFSYEYEHEDYIDKYRAAFCSAQYISCESKRAIMENNPEEQKIQEKYHDENVYLRYENYNCKDENNNPVEHYLTLSLQKFSENKLLNMINKNKK